MAAYTKPLPIISEVNRPYWEAAKRHELRLQKCSHCGKVWLPVGPLCPFCWSREYEWVAASGKGNVTSWLVFHQPYFEGFKPELPYNVVQVQLEEGPRMLSNLVGVPNDAIRMDMPVEVCFDDVTDEVALPKFRPRA